jgi:hypothetical protein
MQMGKRVLKHKKEIKHEDVNWIHLAQDWDQWKACVNVVIF